MDEIIDTNAIYRAVLNRKNSKKLIPGLYQLGVAMSDKVQAFLLSPTPLTLSAFERVELAWFDLRDDPSLRHYAPELRRAFRRGQVQYLPNVIKNPWNPQYNPKHGFIYAFWNPMEPALLKVGSCTQHPWDRCNDFKKKHGIKELKIMFFFEIDEPAKIEKRMNDVLHPARHSSRYSSSVEWFRVLPIEALRYTQQAIDSFRVRVGPLQFVDKRIKSIDDKIGDRSIAGMVRSPNGYIAKGGRRVTREEVEAALAPRIASPQGECKAPRGRRTPSTKA